jgi:hypothetical protein
LNFDEAKRIYIEVTHHSRFASEPAHERERWAIFSLYLDYLLIGSRQRRYLLTQKKYRKVIKAFPSYSKDKRGMNVCILLLNILLLLEKNKQDMIVEQLEALSTYRFTHLHGKNSRESAILFQLIKLMVRYDFDYNIIFEKAKRLEEKLRLTKPSLGELKECVQILPPEWMWARMKEAMAINTKKRNKSAKKRRK